MQKLGRSKRDVLERQLLELAHNRTDYLAQIDAKMIAVQKLLEEREARRYGGNDMDTGHDSMDAIPAEFMSGPMTYADSHPAQGIESADGGVPGERAARTMRLLIALLTLVSTDQRRPRLTASACLLALGADCASMRDVARAESVSPECVSLHTERIRKLFSLPTNQHNKPAYARAKYRAHRLAHPVKRGAGNVSH